MSPIMRYTHIAARVFNTPLLIHPQKLDAIIAGLGPRILGVNQDDLKLGDGDYQVLAPELFSTKRGAHSKDGGYSIVDGVAVVGINGATVHRSRMEGASTFLLGYNDITAMVEHAMENTDVHAVLRVYDSPGGEVQGAFEHADRMRALIGKKPMVAIADGMAASAAYLGGSAADELVITRTGYAGSIGVVMRHVDFSRALANDGIHVTHIFAGAHKVDGNPYAPLPDGVRADFQDEINSLYEMFVQAVVANRRISGEAVRNTEAAVFRGEAAIKAGLADRIATTDQLISELAAKRSTRSYGLPARATAIDKGETNMSGTTAPAGEHDQPVNLTQQDVEKARAEGFAAGATAERQRIQDVEAQALPGHEALISALKFDGKTTGPEAAVQVLNAERSANTARHQQMQAERPAPVPHAGKPEENPDSGQEAGLSIEERAKATWDKDENIRAEFGAFATYLAYAKAHASGSVKVLNKSTKE
jgi:signal peptide peptidase SppA